jgi:hypothetical protein
MSKALKERGGKHLLLRLEPEHMEAIEKIRRHHGLNSQTDAILAAIENEAELITFEQ